MTVCKVCIEKQREITRILSAYKRDKKYMQIVILSQMAILIAFLTYGKDGIKYMFDAIIKLLPGV